MKNTEWRGDGGRVYDRLAPYMMSQADLDDLQLLCCAGDRVDDAYGPTYGASPRSLLNRVRVAFLPKAAQNDGEVYNASRRLFFRYLRHEGHVQLPDVWTDAREWRVGQL